MIRITLHLDFDTDDAVLAYAALNDLMRSIGDVTHPEPSETSRDMVVGWQTTDDWHKFDSKLEGCHSRLDATQVQRACDAYFAMRNILDPDY